MTATRTAQPMSALETAFVALDSRDVAFAHASILGFDRPIALAALRTLVDAALAGVPRYHQRIARRWLRTAAWVDDDDYRIDRHVHAATVAAPGGAHELDDLAGHLVATELPAGHPPWRLWTVAGLAGDRGAVIAVFHHALIDGIAGFRLLEYVFHAGAAAPSAAPSAAPPDARHPLRRLLTWKTVTAAARLLRDGVRPAAQIGLNPRRTSAARSVASHSVALAEMTAIGRTLGATNNDVVLAIVTGALRRMLARRGVDPGELRDVRAAVPVGRHAPGDRDPAGNRVVLLLARLPIDEADPVRCVHRVGATMRALKGGHTVSGGDLMVALSELTTPALLIGTLRLSLRMRAFNLIVTNVPGPPVPLSLPAPIGARLTRLVPIVNLWPGQALGIAAASYAGTMTFGIHADREVIHDAGQLRDDLAAAFDALRDAAARKPGAPARPPDGAPQVRAMHRQGT